MAKFQSPLLGYNNNVRHKGRVFHIQTEDSGVNHPHIITHLFMDGGRILKREKKSYAEPVGADKMSDTVRVLMKEQHKAMFVALRDGDFDHLVDAGSVVAKAAPPIPVAAQPPPPVAAPPPPPPPVESIPPPTEASPARPSSAPSTQPSGVSPGVTETAAWGVSRDDSSVEVSVAEAEISVSDLDGFIPPSDRMIPAAAALPQPHSENQPNTMREPERGRPSAEELTLDFDALERDLGSNVNPLFQGANLPPPPANLFSSSRAEPGTGKYRAAAPPPGEPPPPQQRAERPSRPPPTERYVSSRPAAIFGNTAKPSVAPASIFGDDLVSDKSLDEVILSYLAEDLDPPRRK